ncbi:MAG: hypothetical protein U0228_38935 [Myxococcaceae bacterium]
MSARAQLVTAFVALAGSGCFPVFSPPVRGLEVGMPDRVKGGQLEVAGTLGGPIGPSTWSAHAGYGLSDELIVEGGAQLNAFEGQWGMGFGDVRLVRSIALSSDVRLSGDLAFGAGVGGHRNSKDSALGASFGVFDGLGLGLRWKWLGAFVRARVEGTTGQFSPPTLWSTLLGGLEAKVVDRFVISAAGGSMGLWNESMGWVHLWLWQVQLAVLFDMLRP